MDNKTKSAFESIAREYIKESDDSFIKEYYENMNERFFELATNTDVNDDAISEAFYEAELFGFMLGFNFVMEHGKKNARKQLNEKRKELKND